eukprot:g2787.t1
MRQYRFDSIQSYVSSKEYEGLCRRLNEGNAIDVHVESEAISQVFCVGCEQLRKSGDDGGDDPRWRTLWRRLLQSVVQTITPEEAPATRNASAIAQNLLRAMSENNLDFADDVSVLGGAFVKICSHDADSLSGAFRDVYPRVAEMTSQKYASELRTFGHLALMAHEARAVFGYDHLSPILNLGFERATTRSRSRGIEIIFDLFLLLANQSHPAAISNDETSTECASGCSWFTEEGTLGVLETAICMLHARGELSCRDESGIYMLFASSLSRICGSGNSRSVEVSSQFVRSLILRVVRLFGRSERAGTFGCLSTAEGTLFALRHLISSVKNRAKIPPPALDPAVAIALNFQRARRLPQRRGRRRRGPSFRESVLLIEVMANLSRNFVVSVFQGEQQQASNMQRRAAMAKEFSDVQKDAVQWWLSTVKTYDKADSDTVIAGVSNLLLLGSFGDDAITADDDAATTHGGETPRGSETTLKNALADILARRQTCPVVTHLHTPLLDLLLEESMRSTHLTEGLLEIVEKLVVREYRRVDANASVESPLASLTQIADKSDVVETISSSTLPGPRYATILDAIAVNVRGDVPRTVQWRARTIALLLAVVDETYFERFQRETLSASSSTPTSSHDHRRAESWRLDFGAFALLAASSRSSSTDSFFFRGSESDLAVVAKHLQDLCDLKTIGHVFRARSSGRFVRETLFRNVTGRSRSHWCETGSWMWRMQNTNARIVADLIRRLDKTDAFALLPPLLRANNSNAFVATVRFELSRRFRALRFHTSASQRLEEVILCYLNNMLRDGMSSAWASALHCVFDDCRRKEEGGGVKENDVSGDSSLSWAWIGAVGSLGLSKQFWSVAAPKLSSAIVGCIVEHDECLIHPLDTPHLFKREIERAAAGVKTMISKLAWNTDASSKRAIGYCVLTLFSRAADVDFRHVDTLVGCLRNRDEEEYPQDATAPSSSRVSTCSIAKNALKQLISDTGQVTEKEHSSWTWKTKVGYLVGLAALSSFDLDESTSSVGDKIDDRTITMLVQLLSNASSRDFFYDILRRYPRREIHRLAFDRVHIRDLLSSVTRPSLHTHATDAILCRLDGVAKAEEEKEEENDYKVLITAMRINARERRIGLAFYARMLRAHIMAWRRSTTNGETFLSWLAPYTTTATSITATATRDRPQPIELSKAKIETHLTDPPKKRAAASAGEPRLMNCSSIPQLGNRSTSTAYKHLMNSMKICLGAVSSTLLSTQMPSTRIEKLPGRSSSEVFINRRLDKTPRGYTLI